MKVENVMRTKWRIVGLLLVAAVASGVSAQKYVTELEEGKYYYVQSAYDSTYLGVESSGVIAAEEAHMLQFVASGDSGYYIYDVDTELYVGTPNSTNGRAQVKSADSAQYVYSVVVSDTTVEFQCLNPAASNVLNTYLAVSTTSRNSGKVVSTNSSANATQWYVIELWEPSHPYITSLDSISSSKSYYLETARGGFYYQTDSNMTATGASFEGCYIEDQENATSYEYALIKHDGLYFIYNVGQNGFLLEGYGDYDSISLDNKNIGQFVIAEPNDTNFSGYKGDNGGKTECYRWWFATSDSAKAINYDGSHAPYFLTTEYSDSGNCIAIREGYDMTAPTVYDVDITKVGFSTLALPDSTLIPTGIMPYIAVSQSDGVVIFSEALENADDYNILPDSTGVLIGGDERTYFFPNITENGKAIATEGNLMVACVEATYLAAGAGYLLVNNDNKPMFRISGGVTVPAYRAYVPAESSENSTLYIAFGSGMDGAIEGIDATVVSGEDDGDGAYYDLQGRRVLNPRKGGIYIKDGKKIMK